MVGPDRDRANAIGGVSDAFRGALVNGYKGLGANQYARPIIASSDIYYRKAADAAAGRPVPLEDPANWTFLTEADRQEVTTMRPTMQSWIDANSARDPQAAAAQQLKFRLLDRGIHEGEYATPPPASRPRRRSGARPGRGRLRRPQRHGPDRPSCARRASSTSPGTAMTC